MIDLQKYCGNDPFRPYLEKPFSHGDFTYATNGHILVRLPRQDGVPEQTKEGKWDAPLKGIEAGHVQFAPLLHKPLPAIPASTEQDCLDCEGRGTDHTCPDCTCTCDACDGSGKQTRAPKMSTTIRGGIFDLRYIALVLELPGAELMTKLDGEEPLLFRFDGGVGAVMPMRGKHNEHVEIEADKAA